MGFKKIEEKKSRVNTVRNTIRGGSLGVKTYVTNARLYCVMRVSSGGGDNDQLQIIFTGVNEPCAN